MCRSEQMLIIGILVLNFFGLNESLNFISPKNVDHDLVISTSTGYVQGIQKLTYTGNPYWSYQAIPFAQPPLGNLRFKPPELPSPWGGILDGTKEGPACVETMNTLDNDVIVMGEEDCLYINVYTPNNQAYFGISLPVLVWIYGGAFSFGNSSTSIYGGDNFLDQDIIVVTFNYRVGPFGFLSTDDLESPGNYGLKDQNLALQWVQTNIKNFGGDKKRVTIAGQSAGSASVLYQLASPKSRGLFQSAIASSGSPLCNWAFKYNPRVNAFDMGLASGIRAKSTKELMAKLRKTSLDRLKKASRMMFLIFAPQNDRNGFPFGPTVEPYHDRAFITKNVYSSFQEGDFNRVPILMGMNSLETLFFVGALNLLKPLNFIYDLSPGSLPGRSMNINTPDERREAGLKIIKYYFAAGSYIGATDQEYLQFTSDDRFTRPLHKTVELASRHTPLYYYLYSYISDYGARALKGFLGPKPVQGVAHLEDLFYIWKKQGVPEAVGLDKIISRRLTKIWTNFIKTRNPTPIKEEILQGFIWPTVTSPKNITYLQIDKDISIQHNYRGEHMHFWEQLYNKYGHPPYFTY